MFERQRDPGFWTFDSVVTEDEFEYFDQSISNALDGAGGGAYSLSDHLTIGGAPGIHIGFDVPLQLGSTLFVNDDVFILGELQAFGGGDFAGNYNFHDGAITIGASGADAVTINAFTQFNEIAIFNDTAFFNDDVTIAAGADLNIDSGAVTIGLSGSDSLFVESLTQFQNTVNFNGAVFFNGATDFTDPATFEDTVSMQRTLTFAGAGRMVQRQTMGGNADASYSPTTTMHVIVQNGGISSDRTYTIDDTGAVDGDRIRFTNFSSAHAIDVRRPGDGSSIGSSIGALMNAASTPMSLDAERVVGVWQSVLFVVPPP